MRYKHWGIERLFNVRTHNERSVSYFLCWRGSVLGYYAFFSGGLPSKLTRTCAARFIPGRIPICDPNCLRIRERPSAKYQTNHEWNSPYSHPLEYKSPSTSSSFLYSCSLLSLYFVLQHYTLTLFTIHFTVHIFCSTRESLRRPSELFPLCRSPPHPIM